MGSLFFPPRASTAAGEVDALYMYLLIVSGIMTFLIFLAVLVFSIKYRRKDPNERPKAIHGSIPLEIIWSVIPFLAMLVMFAWGTKLYFQNYTAPRTNTLDIYVTGKQWMWKIQYPGGQREINALHVPTGRPVKLVLASEDVIHSFFIPAFRLKHDVVPGSYQSYWFEATTPGRYHLFCAEYCGTNHSEMTGWVTVMEPTAYAQWLADETQGESMLQQGARLFAQYGCLNCHLMNGGGRGPSLQDAFGHPVELDNGRTVIADENYLRESILNPNAKIVKGYARDLMPVYQGQIGEDGLLPLIVYMKSLSGPPSNTSTQAKSTKQ